VRRHPGGRIDAVDDNGHDSFLDIVANLVGILVILIMVVGVRMRRAQEEPLQLEIPVAVEEAPTPDDAADRIATRDALIDKIAKARQATKAIELDTQSLDHKIGLLADETNRRTAQRDQLQIVASAIESEIQIQRAELDEQNRSAFDAAQAVAAAQHELEQARSAAQTVALEAMAEKEAPTILTHYRTPIAKTVFGHEEHFRISEGRISRIPLNELVDALYQDAKSKKWKLKGAPQFTETLDPIDGFRLKYSLGHAGLSFQLYPVTEDAGQRVAAALAADAPLRQHLDALSPRDTTITVWTYPDSYAELREFQALLIQRGFRVAARPLPAGHPIGGSQQGRRSAAQ